MAFVVIPTRQDSAVYTQDVVLDGTTFRMAMRHNSRELCWYVDFFDIDGNVLRRSIKIVDDFPLFALWRDFSARPIQGMYAINKSDLIGPPTLGELGVNSILVYGSPD